MGDMTDMTEFAVKELKKIFIYNKSTECDTWERTKKKGYVGWDKHRHCTNVGDGYLTRSAKAGNVSFLFKRIVNDPRSKEKEKENENNMNTDNKQKKKETRAKMMDLCSSDDDDGDNYENFSMSDGEYDANDSDSD